MGRLRARAGNPPSARPGLSSLPRGSARWGSLRCRASRRFFLIKAPRFYKSTRPRNCRQFRLPRTRWHATGRGSRAKVVFTGTSSGGLLGHRRRARWSHASKSGVHDPWGRCRVGAPTGAGPWDGFFIKDFVKHSRPKLSSKTGAPGCQIFLINK